MWRRLSVALALVFLCGCFKTKDELTLNADGSGKVRIETRSSVPPGFLDSVGLGTRMASGGLVYPPLSEAEAGNFFPRKNFNVRVKQEKADDGDVTTIVEVEFKDLNALLASPYGRAHQLLVNIEKGSLVVKGVTGLEAAARFAEMKDDSGMGMDMMSGLADLQKKKDEMRAEFRVTLPNPISAANGTREDKTAVWIVERAKCKDAADFAKQLGTVVEARCAAEGLKLSPVTPPRLALLPFAELAAGGAAESGAAPATNAIAAAVKFVPYGLLVTRSLDLSGKGGSQENQAQLIGAVVVPQEYVPQQWGEAKLDEVIDAKGNNLKPRDSEEARFASMLSRHSMGDDGEEEESATNNASEQRRVLTLTFQPPDWKINEIARIKGLVGLQYFGTGSQVVKLTNAVPAAWLMDLSKSARSGSFGTAEKRLASPALEALGLSVSLQMSMVQSGMTMLTLQVDGKQAALTDAQVFDADGRPWPTFLQPQDGSDAGMCQIIVAGKPQPPLSLALLASSGGGIVQVPILLEHVNLNTK